MFVRVEGVDNVFVRVGGAGEVFSVRRHGHVQDREGAVGVPVVRVERDARFGERLFLDFYVAAEGLAAAINDEFFSSRSEAETLWIGW